MGRKASKIVKIGDIFHTWEVISKAEGYDYNCKCIECGTEKVISKYNLLRNTYAICKKCGVKSVLESNIETILRYWNKDLNDSCSTEDILENPSATYWFTCSKGHNFRKTIRDFTPECCPTCKKLKGSDSKASIKKLDGSTFAQCYPHLMEHWNFRKNKDRPGDVIIDVSKKKYWFNCAEGHEFTRTPNEIRKGLWCPYCSDNFYVERLKIITQTLAEATFDSVQYIETEGLLLIEDRKVVIAILNEQYDNPIRSNYSKPSDFVDTFYEFVKVKRRYQSLGYDFITLYATNNLEKDIDIMKNTVLNLL